MRLARRLGRRGLLLSTLGFTWILIGYGAFIRPIPDMPGAFHLMAPPWLRGTVWVFTGVVAVIYAWHPAPQKLPRRRQEFAPKTWKQLHDTDAFGWAALYLMPAVRIFSYGGAYAAWVLDQVLTAIGGQFADVLQGTPDAWYSMALHFPMILIVLICSGWPEPGRGESL